MKDFIFVCLVEMETLQSLTSTLANSKACSLYKISTDTKLDIPIVKKFADVFQVSLPGLPPRREIKHKIKIIGTLLKPTLIYKLSLLKTKRS